MLIAAIGNIDGNLPALEAVLREIDDAGIQTIVNTGDCVVGHPWPDEVIDLLRGRNIPTVQGKQDRLVARFERKRRSLERDASADEFARIREAHEAARSGNIEFLAALPKQLFLTIDGISVCLCHGTPQNQNDALREKDDIGRFRRLRETANTDVIICGRSHTPFSRIVDNTLFVSPGAVGISAEGSRQAKYATISTETEPWEALAHSVAY
jgi:predicted phosphodiesterase